MENSIYERKNTPVNKPASPPVRKLPAASLREVVTYRLKNVSMAQTDQCGLLIFIPHNLLHR